MNPISPSPDDPAARSHDHPFPSSVLEWHRASGGAGGKLHFRYDIAALKAVATAEDADDPEELVKRLREENTRLAAMVTEGNLLRRELVREQEQRQHLSMELTTARAQRAHAVLYAQQLVSALQRMQEELRVVKSAGQKEPEVTTLPNRRFACQTAHLGPATSSASPYPSVTTPTPPSVAATWPPPVIHLGPALPPHTSCPVAHRSGKTSTSTAQPRAPHLYTQPSTEFHSPSQSTLKRKRM
ncbi:hypothetical protein B0H14DRAFT_3859841 [Mycena olivaceomarginata]|nr:hypothetical protein B0H14DRAFT_3859841 [Mycena olivaceomarginata]